MPRVTGEVNVTTYCATEEFVAPKPLRATKSAVEEYASKVAGYLSFKPGDDITLAVAKMGGDVITGSSGLEDVQSGSLVAKSLSEFTIYVSPFTSFERDRFTIAHELGHLFMHLPMVQKNNISAIMRATRYIDETSDELKRAEWEANWFAAALLMPAEEFRKAADLGMAHVKTKFRVSSSAALARAKSLNIEL